MFFWAVGTSLCISSSNEHAHSLDTSECNNREKSTSSQKYLDYKESVIRESIEILKNLHSEQNSLSQQIEHVHQNYYSLLWKIIDWLGDGKNYHEIRALLQEEKSKNTQVNSDVRDGSSSEIASVGNEGIQDDYNPFRETIYEHALILDDLQKEVKTITDAIKAEKDKLAILQPLN
ncbi:hypothetical protein ENBRE01_2388 [Enteropsectra breve]|nr:hypothetical protein ENBRE01_2388 [Enteropsectra breve]